MANANDTLDRIQREIQEALEREEELRRKYNSINNNEPEAKNGFTPPPNEPPVNGFAPVNGFKPQNSRIFTPNPSSKGVMQKFLKMRGKLNMVSMKPKSEPQKAWAPDLAFEPAKVEPGRHVRNGFVSAEEKMKRELQDFERREAELRLERQKSQPDLMAALRQEEESEMKPARSLVSLYSSEENFELKPARSLADLCDASDEELESRRTFSLIRQFESLSHS